MLRAAVLVRGIHLGEVESVLLDGEEARIVGFDVLCGDGANRFLPLAAARMGSDGIEIDSTLTLLDPSELEFYRSRGRSLALAPALADAVVERNGVLVSSLTARC
ncbi:MAG: hypothetical protein ACRDNB_08335 [Gaiellaceae bacterium]